jgi:hypothetical protein
MRRLVPLAMATAAVAALAVIPVPTAYAAAANTCNGVKTDITGGSKSEKFTLTQTKRVINAHGGNDVIEMGVRVRNFLDFPATVCMGSGNDILRSTGDGPEGVPVRYLDGGAGFDTAEIYICFEGDAGPKWTLRNVEQITVINCLD